MEELTLESYTTNKKNQGWDDKDITRTWESRDRCNLCHLCQDKDTGYVLVKSNGAIKPKIMVVGEAPGYEESRTGISFVGPAARHGQSLGEAVGVPMSLVRFANTTRCFPHEKNGLSPRTPKFEEETQPCLPYLWEEISDCDPKVIIALGKYATSVFMGKAVPITTVAGKAFKWVHPTTGKDYIVIPSVHYSADLRSGGKHKESITRVWRLAHDLIEDAKIPVKSTVLNNTETAISFLKNLIEEYKKGAFKFVSFDIEYDVLVFQDKKSEADRMSSLDLFNPDKKLAAVSFALNEEEGFCIPMACKGSLVDYDRVIAWLAKVLNVVPVLVHNYLKAEGAWIMQKVGVKPILFADTMMESFVLYMKTISHGLKSLMKKHFGWPDWSTDMDVYLQSLPPEERSYANVPLDIMGIYSATDPVATMKLHNFLMPQIEADEDLANILEILHQASRDFLDMEQRGAFIDLELLEHLKKRYPEIEQELLEKIKSFDEVKEYEEERVTYTKKGVAKPFTYEPDSPQHVGDLIYSKFGAPLPAKDVVNVEMMALGVNLQKGDIIVPIRGKEHLKGKPLWFGNPNGEVGAERARIKEADGSTITLSKPLRYDHQKPVYTLFNYNPTTDKNYVVEMIKALECKECRGDGCATCKGYGVATGNEKLSEFLYTHHEYKKVQKIITGYINSIQNYIIPGTNRIVFNYLLHATKTGRFATKDFSLHTLPWKSDIRRLFVSKWKDKGGVILSVDHSQLELRVLAAVTRDQVFLDGYFTCSKLCGYVGTLKDKGVCKYCGADLGLDMHKATAASLRNIPISDVTDDQRKGAKAINFGVLYGRGAKSIAQETGMSFHEARKFIRGYFDKFEAVSDWVAEQHETYKTTGFVKSPTGRKLYLEGHDLDENDWQYAKGERESQNYPIQSAGNDLTLMGMIFAKDELKNRGLKSVPWEFTHDSIEYDVYPGELIDTYNTVKSQMEDKTMEYNPWMCVPLKVDAEIGVRWDGACKVKSFKGNEIVLKGKTVFFDELIEALKKSYKVDIDILGVTYEKEVRLIDAKSYEGESGGLEVTEAKITLNKA